MTEDHNDTSQDSNASGFKKASDVAMKALESVQPVTDESKIAEEAAAEVPTAEGKDEPKAADKATESPFVSPHVYETPKATPPASEIPTSPVPVTVPPVNPEVSHTRKPWFYVVTGGLAGLLIGAACVAGCTSLALHAGYGQQQATSTGTTQTQQVTPPADDAANTSNGQGSESSSNNNEGYGYDHGYGSGRDYGYGYPSPYDRDHGYDYGYGYGYGQNPYGRSYDYGYPYGYNYGYPNPYGYGYSDPYGYGYGTPYGYSSPYGYGFDLDDLFGDSYGYNNEDKGQNSGDGSSNGSNERNQGESDSGSNGYDGYGIIDLYELFGGSNDANTAATDSTITMEDILDSFDVSLGDTQGDAYGTGVYTVGKDGIAPGLYYMEGSQSQESNFYIYDTVEGTAVAPRYAIESAVAYIGNYFVELDEGDVLIYKPAESSNVFYSADEAPEAGQSPYESGLYRVGTDIPAGTYKITASSEKLEDASQDRAAYVMNDLEFEEDSIVDTKYVMAGGSQIIEVEDGQWLELYGANAELQK